MTAGWASTTLDELAGYLDRLAGYRREYGTEDRPFEIQVSIIDRLPTPDVCASWKESA